MTTQLWAGLGNPGKIYEKNRHNAGFMILDLLAEQYGFAPWRAKFSALITSGQIGKAKIILLKPQNFMNRSGLPLAEAARFHKIETGQITVFHDEIDLDAGRVRVKTGGGHGGHNGLRDIDRHIGPDYRRVRLGIGRPGHGDPQHARQADKWVLQDFSAAEYQGWLAAFLDALAGEAGLLAAGEDASYASRVAYLSPPAKNRMAASQSPSSNNIHDREAD